MIRKKTWKSGTVEDKDGHPLDGVTMKLYYRTIGSMQDKTQKHLHVAGRLSRAPIKQVRRWQPLHPPGGQYRFETVRDENLCRKQKDGFYPVQRSVGAQNRERGGRFHFD